MPLLLALTQLQFQSGTTIHPPRFFIANAGDVFFRKNPVGAISKWFCPAPSANTQLTKLRFVYCSCIHIFSLSLSSFPSLPLSLFYSLPDRQKLSKNFRRSVELALRCIETRYCYNALRTRAVCVLCMCDKFSRDGATRLRLLKHLSML